MAVHRPVAEDTPGIHQTKTTAVTRIFRFRAGRLDADRRPMIAPSIIFQSKSSLPKIHHVAPKKNRMKQYDTMAQPQICNILTVYCQPS